MGDGPALGAGFRVSGAVWLEDAGIPPKTPTFFASFSFLVVPVGRATVHRRPPKPHLSHPVPITTQTQRSNASPNKKRCARWCGGVHLAVHFSTLTCVARCGRCCPHRQLPKTKEQEPNQTMTASASIYFVAAGGSWEHYHLRSTQRIHHRRPLMRV
jgi:hypothetical protein